MLRSRVTTRGWWLCHTQQHTHECGDGAGRTPQSSPHSSIPSLLHPLLLLLHLLPLLLAFLPLALVLAWLALARRLLVGVGQPLAHPGAVSQQRRLQMALAPPADVQRAHERVPRLGLT